jgi:hypothetical protein
MGSPGVLLARGLAVLVRMPRPARLFRLPVRRVRFVDGLGSGARWSWLRLVRIWKPVVHQPSLLPADSRVRTRAGSSPGGAPCRCLG